MSLAVHFSSASPHWATPKAVYDGLDAEFHFNYDPCPLRSEADGLAVGWGGKRVFCNPPYGPKIRGFLDKAREAELSVYLLPARTDTRWFHEVVLPFAQEIRFIKGRLRFGDAKAGAPFPSMIAVFKQ